MEMLNQLANIIPKIFLYNKNIYKEMNFNTPLPTLTPNSTPSATANDFYENGQRPDWSSRTNINMSMPNGCYKLNTKLGVCINPINNQNKITQVWVNESGDENGQWQKAYIPFNKSSNTSSSFCATLPHSRVNPVSMYENENDCIETAANCKSICVTNNLRVEYNRGGCPTRPNGKVSTSNIDRWSTVACPR